MRILLLTQLLPYPPDSGSKVKTWNMLRYLAGSHDVELISFVREGDAKHFGVLDAICSKTTYVPITRNRLRDVLFVLQSVLTRQPFFMLRDRRRAMQQALAHSNAPEVVIADKINMAQYALTVNAPTRILDRHDSLWLLYSRLANTSTGLQQFLLKHEWPLLKRYEGAMARRFDGVVAVSPTDGAAHVEAGAERVTVIPIGVDGDALQPVVASAQADRILHIGTMTWPPNIAAIEWFLDEVLPLVRREHPAVGCDLIGKQPPQSLKNSAENDPTLNLPGYVEDVTPYLSTCGVFIVPLLAGGGMRVKILEALARELPVVTTSLGCEGIDAVDGEHLLVADSAEAFAAAINRLLDDQPFARQLGKNGRQLIMEKYDYRVALKPLEGLL